VLLVSLFVGPLLGVGQQLATQQLRQISVQSISQSIARDFALSWERSNPDPQAHAIALLKTLAVDAGVVSQLLDIRIECEPQQICTTASTSVSVTADYRGVTGVAWHLLDERGSMSPLILGVLSIVLALTVAGANVEALELNRLRADALARYLVQISLPNSAEQLDLTKTAVKLTKNTPMVSVELATLFSPDAKTKTAQVCLRFESPLWLFGLGRMSTSCASASLRLVGGLS
jgi:hypothetical protein